MIDFKKTEIITARDLKVIDIINEQYQVTIENKKEVNNFITNRGHSPSGVS